MALDEEAQELFDDFIEFINSCPDVRFNFNLDYVTGLSIERDDSFDVRGFSFSGHGRKRYYSDCLALDIAKPTWYNWGEYKLITKDTFMSEGVHEYVFRKVLSGEEVRLTLYHDKKDLTDPIKIPIDDLIERIGPYSHVA